MRQGREATRRYHSAAVGSDLIGSIHSFFLLIGDFLVYIFLTLLHLTYFYPYVT